MCATECVYALHVVSTSLLRIDLPQSQPHFIWQIHSSLAISVCMPEGECGVYCHRMPSLPFTRSHVHSFSPYPFKPCESTLLSFSLFHFYFARHHSSPFAFCRVHWLELVYAILTYLLYTCLCIQRTSNNRMWYVRRTCTILHIYPKSYCLFVRSFVNLVCGCVCVCVVKDHQGPFMYVIAYNAWIGVREMFHAMRIFLMFAVFML